MATRFLGVCGTCKKRHTALATRGENVPLSSGGWAYSMVTETGAVIATASLGRLIVPCECGRRCVGLSPVKGKFVAEHKCDARCTSAKGHSCECSCGGKNHGSGGVTH